jgi:hypothetical protein
MPAVRGLNRGKLFNVNLENNSHIGDYFILKGDTSLKES